MKERILTNTEPVDVFKYFEDLTFIPRESGNEKEVSDYLVNFAKDHGLEWYQDEFYNVLIKKPATPGYEDHPTIIVQAHMDMVCEKNRDVEHDFAKDPINFVIEDGKVIAKDTTLGADDGIGVAFGLAALADEELKHPAIEFVCTSDEERGMSGIENFDFSLLKGDRVINIDSDDEGVIVVGCAGGPVIRIELPISKVAADSNKAYYELTLRGLRGGHSGEDIHRGRANANKLFVRVLGELDSEIGIDIADVTGGLKYNAIPRNAEAIIAIDADKVDAFAAIVDKYNKIFYDEYRVNDPDIVLAYEKVEAADTILAEDAKTRVLDFIDLAETGIIRMDQDYPTFVESSISLGVVSIKEDVAEIWVMTRSSMDSQFELMREKVLRLTRVLGGTYEIMSNCPAWQFDPQSELKLTFERIYKDMYGEMPSFMILHAGLEPGEFKNFIERPLDMISLGPDIRFLHAPGEYVDIESTRRVWVSFKAFLEAL